MNCMKCGSNTETLKSDYPSWVDYSYCFNCDITVKTIYADRMSGNHQDQIYILSGKISGDS